MDYTDDSSGIQVTIRFFGLFKQITQKREFSLVLPQNTTVSSLLEAILNEFPQMKEKIFDEQYKVHNWVIILINGRNINIYEGLNTSLKGEDIVAIFPPVAGG